MRLCGRASRSNAETAETAEKTRLRVLCGLCVLFVGLAACSSTSLFRQYEYEEDVYLSLDGSATVYVNGSLAALNALRGTSFDPNARVDTAAVRAYYSSPVTRVSRVTQSRRSNRRFVHVRLDTDDIRRLSEAPPFAWSTYRLTADDTLYRYLQTVGAAAGKDVGSAGWTGREMVAFRLHLPSKIRYHNTGGGVGRGNILVWEQPLADRLRGMPLTQEPGGILDARMDRQSILYRTLWLFGITFLAVAAAFGVVMWWVMRRGGEKSVEAGTGR
jgi:hypothetical protein